VSLGDLARSWERLAREDPLWAILVDPAKRGNRWRLDDFFALGRKDVKDLLDLLASLELQPQWNGSALDFGCGVGRITQALAAHFGEVVGVDISRRMIRLARRYNNYRRTCAYRVNKRSDLSLFADRRFDFVFCFLVLQHMEEQYSIRYIGEFLRVLKPAGILVFQVATRQVAGERQHPVGAPGTVREPRGPGWLRRLLLRSTAEPDLQDLIRMHSVDESLIGQAVERNKCRIVHVRTDSAAGSDFESKTFFVTKPPVPA
jgi:SAM-dependent methyltransferase